MDGVTKQLSDYLHSLEAVGDMAIEAVKEQIDIEATAVEQSLKDTTPVATSGLKASLTRTDIDTPKRYGKRLEYDGSDPHGTPYAKIANILEYGTSTIKPHNFIRKAVKKLKGLDDRASQRFEDKTKGIEK